MALALAFSASAAYAELPQQLYMIGDATVAEWDCDNPLELTKESDTKFTITTNLFVGEFKFPWVKGGAMWSSKTYMPMNNGAEVGTAGLSADNREFYLSPNGQPDEKWKVTTAGRYQITLNLENSGEFGTIDVKYLGECANMIYMLGSAVGKWDSTGGKALIEEGDGKYVWEGTIGYSDEDKCLKFCETRGNWDQVTFFVPDHVDYNGNVLKIAPGTYDYMESTEYVNNQGGNLKDWFWGVEEGKTGKYRVTVDTNTKKMSLDLIELYAFDKDNVNELYMLGLAAESFNSEEPLAMTALGDGRFSWKGTLNYNTNDGDDNHANKQFKFCTPKGAWNQVYYLVPLAATADGYIEKVGEGTYPLKDCTWLYGQQGVDAFFGVNEGVDEEYTVTVDTRAMNVTLSKSISTNAIEGIETSRATAEAVYTLQGVRVYGDNCPAGLYLVKYSDGSVRKIRK